MRIIILICVSIFFANQSIAQQQLSNKISFELGYGRNFYSMDKLNSLYIDSVASRGTSPLLKEHIKSGNQFQLALHYQPLSHIEIGLYGNYQYGSSKSKVLLNETDDYGFAIVEHCGASKLLTSSIGTGIVAAWNIDGLLKWQEKTSILNRLHFGIEVKGGINFSKASMEVHYPTFNQASSFEEFTSNDFYTAFGLKVEYDFSKSPIFTTLGLRFGYQLLKTKAVKNRDDQEWITGDNSPINLDFSGLYVGTYLRIGK